MDDGDVRGKRSKNRVCLALRNLQWQTNASDKQLSATLDAVKEIADLLHAGEELPENIRASDRTLRQEVLCYCFA